MNGRLLPINSLQFVPFDKLRANGLNQCFICSALEIPPSPPFAKWGRKATILKINQEVTIETYSPLCKRGARGDLKKLSNGFTLLELLIVLVIVGITLGMVTLKVMPDDQQILQNDAQRIASLLQLARDEAIVRNHPIAFEAESDRYRFLMYNDNAWQLLKQDELLRERTFKKSPVTLGIQPTSSEPGSSIRIIFGREPVDKPFDLTLSIEQARVVIHADGIGHFVVQ